MHQDIDAKFEVIRTKLDECEKKIRKIFERCAGSNLISSEQLNTESIREENIRGQLYPTPTPDYMERALVVHEEYLSLILSGCKSEEIRSKACSPGWTALCTGGIIYGVAEILRVVEESDAIQYLISLENVQRHRIGSHIAGTSESTVRSKIADFLSDIGVNSRGHYYLKYWPNPLEFPRIYRWCFGRVYRTQPIPLAARAYTRSWIKLDRTTGASICESLMPALPNSIAVRLQETPQLESGKARQISSRFFSSRALPAVGQAASATAATDPATSNLSCLQQRRRSIAPSRYARPAVEPVSEGSGSSDSTGGPTDRGSDEEWRSAFDEAPAGSAPKRLRMTAALPT